LDGINDGNKENEVEARIKHKSKVNKVAARKHFSIKENWVASIIATGKKRREQGKKHKRTVNKVA
jgi:hypothetical protein